MRIFISYARKDRGAIEALHADLEYAHYQVWMDNELSGGQAWWDAILEQIRACDLYIFALSPASLRSRACSAELDYALALSRPLLPARIRDVAIQLAPPAIARHADRRLPNALDRFRVGLDGRNRQLSASSVAARSLAGSARDPHVIHESISGTRRIALPHLPTTSAPAGGPQGLS
jgi:hypothetical protein